MSEEEFVAIMIILTSQMTWRVVTYQIFVIAMLPYFVKVFIFLFCWAGFDKVLAHAMDLLQSHAPGLLIQAENQIPESFWAQLPSSLVSSVIFSALIPLCWDRMDTYLHQVAENKSSPRNLKPE